MLGNSLNEDIKATTKLIEDIEKSRAELQKTMAKTKDAASKKAVQGLEDQLFEIESGLLDIHQTGARQDNFRNPVQALERFLAIGKELTISSGDHPPTDQQVEVHALTKAKLTAAEVAFKKVTASIGWRKVMEAKP